MAQSFGVPSRECSVAEFDAMRVAGQVEAAWKGFCDCMFIEVAEVTDFMSGGTAIIRCINGRCRNQNNGDDLPGTTLESAALNVSEYARLHNTNYSVKIYPMPNATPDWTKCMSNFCASPGGCPNPILPSLIMPFNVSPGAAVSPWTDMGAAARMIPKRNAGIFYDVTALFTLDLTAYEPLKLWQTFWKNPVLFGLLMTKIQLIPLAGAAYATAMTFTGPPVFLIPGAIESCQRQGKDVTKEVWETAGMGLIEQAKFAIKYLTKCGFGIPGACGIAMAVQKGAQDQIASGEINNVASQEGKAIIAFLAKSGAELVNAVFVVIDDPSKGVEKVFRVFEAGFRSIRNNVTDDNTKKVFDLLTTVFQVAAEIAKGIDAGTDASMIADNVGEILLGFRPTEYFAMIAGGKKQSALDSAQASMARTGNTVEGMIDHANAIVEMLDKVIKAIDDLSQKLGGGLDALTKMFGGMRNDISSSTTAVVQVGQQIDAVTRSALGLPPGSDGGVPVIIPPPGKPTLEQQREAFRMRGQTALTKSPPVKTTLVRSTPTPNTISPVRALPAGTTTTTFQPPAPGNPPAPGSATGGGAGVLLAGAGAGFLIGGPVGAIVGGATLAFLTKK